MCTQNQTALVSFYPPKNSVYIGRGNLRYYEIRPGHYDTYDTIGKTRGCGGMKTLERPVSILQKKKREKTVRRFNERWQQGRGAL